MRACFCGLALMLGLAPAIPGAELRVTITGVVGASGTLDCAVFDRAEGFPGDASKAVKTVSVPARDGAVVTFAGLAPGTYAVAVRHDSNGNGRMDANWLGIPREPWGVSQGARPSMRPPRFAEAAFAVESGTLALAIAVAR